MLVVEKNVQSVESEAYRSLKVNLQYLFNEKKVQSIAVVSADHNEGKSTICSNLALSFSQSNKRVILIDCNLRKSRLHELFQLDNKFGLSNILLGETNIGEAIQQYSENVYVLTGGSAAINTPVESIESNIMTEILLYLKSRFDIIIVDTVQLKDFTDTKVLASKVDGVIIIARSEKTNKESILSIKEKLDQSGANILGMVLNGVKTRNRRIRNG